jgi:type VI secretion system secreted protein Hcp
MAESDFILKMNGIEGESEQKSHEKQIEIESWSFGAHNAGSASIGTGMGTGKVALQDFSFSLPVGKAGPNLLKTCCIGTHIDECILYCRKSSGKGGQVDYAIFTFTDVFVSSYTVSGHNGGHLPQESISFNFTKIKYEYKPQAKDGSLGAAVTADFDVKKGASNS